MNKENQGIYFPSTLETEKIERLKRSPELQQLSLKIIDGLLFSEKPLWGIEINVAEEKEKSEDIDEEAALKYLDFLDGMDM